MEEAGEGMREQAATGVAVLLEQLPARLPAPDEIDAEWALFDRDVEAWWELVRADAEGCEAEHGVRPEHLLDLEIDEVASLTRQLERIAARRARVLERARLRALELEESRAAEREARGLRVEAPSRRRELAHRSVTAEVACATRSAEGAVSRWLADASRLADGADATLAAAESGRITFTHARTIADEVSSLPSEAHSAYEAAVLPMAEQTTPAQFRRRARRMREQMHPDSVEARVAAAAAERHVRITPERDGMAWLGAYLPAVRAASIDAQLDDLAGELGSAEGEQRTMAQLRADVFADLLTGGSSCGSVGPAAGDAVDAGREGVGDGVERGLIGRSSVAACESGDARDTSGSARPRRRGIRPTVTVTVPVMALLGHGDEPAELEGYGPIPVDVARELAGAAPSWKRLLTHPEAGTVLSVGRESYTVPPDLRAWLRVRDGTCRFPGCTRAAARCEVDHTVDWAAGGETRHDNLAHLCARHHHLKHEGGWRVQPAPGGVLHWRSPTGREYSTEPERRIGTGAPDGGRGSPAPPDPPPEDAPF
ncbi:hypothetical protein ARHIZOSPH14_09880 [Agromyces rhizosphaerae]|uniref:HNH nuclease domain-containing protein n=1 Tax=Agromyces rhizosphaerae TaxID=88374 RepID=A0A9W6FNQ3_9MICO|nr:HNH endonuclease signature motif containing protein [Agromyces rhizosphaerae]GLI26746.1 hypothetical protein ARHIZOSPH14_09880 [Agromyces rhizosphaerae]